MLNYNGHIKYSCKCAFYWKSFAMWRWKKTETKIKAPSSKIVWVWIKWRVANIWLVPNAAEM